MRICHVVSALDPSLGGPPVVATRLAAGQSAMGHDVSILHHDDGADKRAAVERAMRDIPGAAGVRLVTLPPPSGGLSGRLAALRGVPAATATVMDGAVAGADLLHLHGVWEPLIRAAAQTAVRRGKPYVIAPHGMLDPWSLRQKALKKKLALALGYRAMLNRAAFLHVLNADEQALLAPLGLRCPMRVIPNGVFLSEIDQPVDAETRPAATAAAADAPVILFLSRLHYKKGLDHLADAFARVHARRPDARLIVAGPDGGERQPFVDRVARLGLTGHVHLAGPVYGVEKFALLRQAHCFCLPSRQEGFSVAILEALACGVPVVISENCHFPEVAEAGAGAVVPLRADPIAEALVDLLADDNRRRRAGEAGRRLVEDRFTWEKVSQRSIDAYESVLAGSGSAA